MIWIGLLTVGTAAVLFALIACCAALAAWIDDWSTHMNTTAARAQLEQAMDNWKPNLEPSSARTKAEIDVMLRYATNRHTAEEALKAVEEDILSGRYLNEQEWLDVEKQVRAALAAMVGTDDART